MKQFKYLDIKGPDHQLLLLIEKVSANLPLGWHRDQKAETRLRELSFSGESAGFAFGRDAKDGDPPVGVFLSRESGRLQVPNIVPRESGKLSKHQYNRILDEFASVLRGNLSQDSGLKLEVGSDEATITDWVSPEAADLLRRFSNCANKATGSSHPSDFRRWTAFLIQVHNEGSTLDSDTLSQWLIEELDWPPDRADKLAIEYEFARDLLRAYDKSQ